MHRAEPSDPHLDDPEIDRIHRLAIGLADENGRRALDRRRRLDGRRFDATAKSTPTDLVTELDHELERRIVEGILAVRPEDSVAGEEGTTVVGSSGVTWSIDPIDGTTNFVYGLATWCVSVAALVDGRSIAGAVAAPALGELYDARLGGGARRNGRPIACSPIAEVDMALVATGFGYEATDRVAAARILTGVIGRIRDIRRLGAAALDLCHVADGRVDAYYERGLNPWDIAAGSLIATEAGAVVSAFDGGPAHPGEILAAGPGIHTALVELLGGSSVDPGGDPDRAQWSGGHPDPGG